MQQVGFVGLGIMGAAMAGNLLEVLSAGLASSKVVEVKGEKFLSHEFTPGARSNTTARTCG